MSRKYRLTKEQEEIRLRGLRILARMIARSLLSSSKGDTGGGKPGSSDGDRERPPVSKGGFPGKDGEHVP